MNFQDNQPEVLMFKSSAIGFSIAPLFFAATAAFLFSRLGPVVEAIQNACVFP